MTSVRCEIDLAMTYAFWAYTAIRETLEETCVGGAELQAKLAEACTTGDGRIRSAHQYWLCSPHGDLLPVLDEVVRRAGDEPRLVGLARPGETEPATAGA